MNKRYKIVITEFAQEKRVVGGDWKEGVKENGGWGYTPEIEATRDVERTVYTQNVEDMDIAAVIRAVNGI